MDKFHIELYPKADLENEWAKNKHTPGAMPCMRCGGPMRKSLAENALSRALNVYVCPACGMDEALRDAAGKVLPISEWYAVKQHRFAEHKDPQAVKLTPACAFMEIFSGARKTLPLSSARYPASLVAYATMLYRTFDYIEQTIGQKLILRSPKMVSFADKDDISSWAIEALGILSNADLFRGTAEGMLDPKGVISIEQAIVLSYRGILLVQNRA